jgi:murein DD-endopeptidase MepM/ murein hydrolase activator NlpD
LGTAVGAGFLLPGSVFAQAGPETVAPPPVFAPLVNPYEGSIPLVFPLGPGTFRRPLLNNWHDVREGSLYPWTHRNDQLVRAHDGVDIHPRPGAPAPVVFAPLAARVSAVCFRRTNTLDAPVTYRVDPNAPPPRDYSRAVDDVAALPLYGNFVWLQSVEAASLGYFVFLTHLQNEPGLRSLRPGRIMTTEDPIGVVGDSGNAEGTPQLHIEIHYPGRRRYICRVCAPDRRTSAINPFPSLAGALRR